MAKKKLTLSNTAKPDKPASSPRATNFDDGSTVKLLVEANPKRKGSEAHKRVAKYKNGMTVAAALKAGVRRDDVRWDIMHGFIVLVPPQGRVRRAAGAPGCREAA